MYVSEILVGNTTENLPFLLVLAADHITGATGKTPTVQISKNGAAFASPAGAVTEVGAGIYQLAANATDANTPGPLVLSIAAPGCDPADYAWKVEQELTAAAVDAQLSGSHGAGLWGSTAAGTGTNQVTITIQDNNGAPIPNVSVTIKNSAQTATLAAGFTNTLGQVVFMLANGTVTVLVQSTQFYTVLPAQTLLVSGTTTATYTLTPQGVVPPVNGSLCAVFGTLTRLDGTPAVGSTVTFTLAGGVLGSFKIPGHVMVVKQVQVVTDANGFFQTNLTRSSQLALVLGEGSVYYQVNAPDANLNGQILVPDQATVDISTLTFH